jgi:hypothetical protein
MTKQPEALTMALHVIQHQGDVDVDDWIAAEKAIKEVLAQQDAEAHLQAVADFGQLQEQEPVAWWDAKIGVFNEKHFDQLQPLYTSPPKREWVGLTNAEVNNVAAGCHLGNPVQDAIRKAEAKLQEKNT